MDKPNHILIKVLRGNLRYERLESVSGLPGWRLYIWPYIPLIHEDTPVMPHKRFPWAYWIHDAWLIT